MKPIPPLNTSVITHLTVTDGLSGQSVTNRPYLQRPEPTSPRAEQHHLSRRSTSEQPSTLRSVPHNTAITRTASFPVIPCRVAHPPRVEGVMPFGHNPTRSEEIRARALMRRLDGMHERRITLAVPNPLLQRKQPLVLLIFLATEKTATKLLATPMRESAATGPSLRRAHSRTGVYLITEFLTSIIRSEEHQVSDVLGHHTTGYRILNESQMTIIALMRVGEPMASGISKLFPLSMFLHTSELGDIKVSHLYGQARVLLVDSVINSSQITLELVDAIRSIDRSIAVVIVAGMVQARCISPNSTSYKALTGLGNITLVGLRASEIKFTGGGGTDTDNRLFHTTHLLRDA